MRTDYLRRAVGGVLVIAGVTVGAFVVAQGVTGGFEGFWGSKYSSQPAVENAAALATRTGALAIAKAERQSRPAYRDR